jgi:hypothetical protein
MADERLIVIRNWDRFQHYKKRRPVWIRDYVAQLDDPDYLGLTLAARGFLHGLRLMFARLNSAPSGRQQPIPVERARAELAQSASEARRVREHLASLNDAGLVRILASTTLASETEREFLTQSEASYAASTAEVFNNDLNNVLRSIPGSDLTIAQELYRGAVSESDLARAREDLLASGRNVRDPARYFRSRALFYARERRSNG